MLKVKIGEHEFPLYNQIHNNPDLKRSYSIFLHLSKMFPGMSNSFMGDARKRYESIYNGHDLYNTYINMASITQSTIWNKTVTWSQTRCPKEYRSIHTLYLILMIPLTMGNSVLQNTIIRTMISYYYNYNPQISTVSHIIIDRIFKHYTKIKDFIRVNHNSMPIVAITRHIMFEILVLENLGYSNAIIDEC